MNEPRSYEGNHETGGREAKASLGRAAMLAVVLAVVGIALTGVALALGLGKGGAKRSGLDFLVAVSCGAEFGGGDARLRKWAQPVRLSVFGKPADVDRAELERVVAELDELVGPLELSLVGSDVESNYEVHFVPERDMKDVEPNYVPGNLGFCWAYWNDEGEITRARVLISTEIRNAKLRHHLIREELTQCLGPLRDDCSRKDSIFYCRYSETTEFAAIDRDVIRALYRDDVRPSADAAELRRALADVEIGD